jgi:hypothetical protein
MLLGKPVAGADPIPGVSGLPALPGPTLPLPTVPLPTLPLPTLPLPTLPLPTPAVPTLPLPTPTLRLPTPTLPLPSLPTPSLPIPTGTPGPTGSSGPTGSPAPTGSNAPTSVPSGSLVSPEPGSSDPAAAGSGGLGVGAAVPPSPGGAAVTVVDREQSPLQFVLPLLLADIPISVIALVVMLQIAGGVAWLPVVRRWLDRRLMPGPSRRPPL